MPINLKLIYDSKKVSSILRKSTLKYRKKELTLKVQTYLLNPISQSCHCTLQFTNSIQITTANLDKLRKQQFGLQESLIGKAQKNPS